MFSGEGFPGPSAAVAPAVCMVTTVVCGPLVPLTVIVGGSKLQVAFCGRLAQENCSVPEYPPTEVMVIVSVTELPGITLSEVLVGATVIVGGAWVTEKMRVALLFAKPRELLV